VRLNNADRAARPYKTKSLALPRHSLDERIDLIVVSAGKGKKFVFEVLEPWSIFWKEHGPTFK